MKKYIVSFIIIACTLLVISCERDKVVFNESQTYVDFEQTNIFLPIVEDATGSVEITVNLSNASENERSIDLLNVVQEGTNAGADTYTVGPLIVPANSYVGTITIDGVDNNVTTEAKTLILRMENNADFFTENGDLTVSIFQVCPIDETFATGMYKLEGVTNELLFGSTILTPGMIFEVTSDGLNRVFQTQEWGGFCFPADGWALHNFTLSLVCNEVIIPLQDTACNCGDAPNNFANGSVNGMYDPTDDSVITFQFIRNCGADSVENTYRLVKQ